MEAQPLVAPIPPRNVWAPLRSLPGMARRSAGSVANGKSTTAGHRLSDRFLAGLQTAERVVFVSHVHPDPDSIGSMLGLAHLVESKLALPTVLTRDGPIS